MSNLPVPREHWLGDLRTNGPVRLFPFGNTITSGGVGLTLLQREALEARPGAASTVTGGGRHLHYLDSAQRAVQSGGASRKPTGKRANAPALRFRKTMWPRETTARSGDIEGAIGSPPAKPMSSGFGAEHRRLCRSEKHEVFGCPRGWVRSRQSADSGRQCDVEHERSGVGERCGRA